jgi:hypothetical protein
VCIGAGHGYHAYVSSPSSRAGLAKDEPYPDHAAPEKEPLYSRQAVVLQQSRAEADVKLINGARGSRESPTI